jgi:hypothetical protein
MSNNRKNIVLRNRTIVVKKKLETSEKKKVLIKLIKDANNGRDKIKKVIKVFDFFIMECVDDYFFRNPRLLSVIKDKLNEGTSLKSFGWELSSKYMCAIFPRSARIEYLLLRAKTNQIQFVKKKKNECSYVKWACCYSPSRTFRNIMDFIGSDYHYKL